MKKLVFLSILIIFSSNLLHAQWTQIHDSKLMSADVNMYCKSGGTIIAATYAGIYRSADNGVNWTISNTGIYNEEWMNIDYVCVFKSAVYAMVSTSGNLYKSVDQGVSWSLVPTNIPPYMHKAALGVFDTTLIIIGYDYDPGSLTVFNTSDLSYWNWGAMMYIYPYNTFQLYSFNPQRCYLVTPVAAYYFFQGFQMLQTIQVPTSGLPSGFANFHNHFSGEENSNYLYTVGNDKIYRYDTATNTWATLTSAPCNGKSIQITNSTDNFLHAATVDFSYNLTINSYLSLDHGINWFKQASTNSYFQMYEDIIQISPSKLVANTPDYDVLYSADTGRTWSKANDFRGFNTYNLVASNNSLITFSEFKGILRSTDGGQTWNYSNTGMYRGYADTSQISINQIFKSGNTVFATVDKSVAADTVYLYKSTNDGVSWAKVTTTPNYPGMHFLGTNGNTFFMRFGYIQNMYDPNTDSFNLFYRSSDGGVTWQQLSAPFFTTMGFKHLYGFIGNGDSILLCGLKINGEQDLYISKDNGNTWTFSSTVYAPEGDRIKTYSHRNSNMQYALGGWGGSSNNQILGVIFNPYNNTDTIVTLTGGIWQPFPMSGLPYPLHIYGVVYYNGFWYMSTHKGIYASKDNAVTWSKKPVTGMQPGVFITSLASISNELYAGTWGNGIWKTKHSQLDCGSDKHVCSGNYVTLSASTDGIQFLSWCCGLGTNSTVTFQPTVTKTYTATGYDNFNIITNDSVKVQVSSPQFLTNYSASPRLFTAQPFMAAFTNNTPNPNNFDFLWLFGDDSTSNEQDPIHEYFYNGTYTVSLIAIDKVSGCRDTFTRKNYIICSGGSTNPCLIQANITYNGSPIICEGDSFLLTASSAPTYHYQWVHNNVAIYGANKYQLYAKAQGDYRVIINDTLCSRISNPFTLSHYPSNKPVIKSAGIIHPCSNDSMQLFITDVYSSYLWSTSETTQSIWVKNSGNYYITIVDNIGCHVRSNPFTINKSYADVPDICLVTVDPFNKKNLIIWERPNTTQITSYKIYKESSSASVYNLIGTLPYDSLSVFMDETSNPAVKADRYRISLVDTCGVESALSKPHMTIHLQANMGTMGEKNLVWNGYEGLSFPSYFIFRGTAPTKIQQIATIASSYRSFTDTTKTPGLFFYMIGFNKGDTCFPAVKRAQTSSGPYSQSVSNIKDYSTTAANYISADPMIVNLGEDAGSSAFILIYTNFMSWDATVDDPTWLNIEKNMGAGYIKVTAITASNSRTGFVTIKGSPTDSTLVTINQGNVGIDNQFMANEIFVYPNPFTSHTNIQYNLTKPANVNLSVFDMVGKKIADLHSGYQTAGNYIYQFSATALGQSDGVYFVLFSLDGKSVIKKIVELK
jgi:PKD repeat protein